MGKPGDFGFSGELPAVFEKIEICSRFCGFRADEIQIQITE